MTDREKALQQLHEKIETLQKAQKQFQAEIQKLQNEVFEFEVMKWTDQPEPKKPVVEPAPEPKATPAPPAPPARVEVFLEKPTAVASSPKVPAPAQEEKEKTSWEEFIGTNLLNKVAIAMLVIGIGYGAKYSIDHDLIDATTRIFIGYLLGIGLIGFAIRLKKKYENFSAVLLSGGMAALYLLTYYAYAEAKIIPQTPAFALMVMFTAFTVYAAIVYNREVIGIIGLVGAYAVPILLSDGSGRVAILFSYMTIVNVGILVLSFRKYWKKLYYIAFALTWMTFAAWFGGSFDIDEHFGIALGFSNVFFITFYVTFLAYKIIRKEALDYFDVIFVLLNSFIAFGYGYIAIEQLDDGDTYLGLYTVFNAVIHFIVCTVIFRMQRQSRDIFYFVAGLVLVFLTIAVPVQLEGNWVTLVWAAEAALLFWIGRSRNYVVYERISYAMILLAIGSLLHDWGNTYKSFYYMETTDATVPVFLNITFLSSVLVTAAIGFILWIHNRYRQVSQYASALSVALPLIVLFLTYFGIFKEVELYWDQRWIASRVQVNSGYGDLVDQYDYDLQNFKKLWLILYSAIFALVVCILRLRIRMQLLTYVSLGINTLVLLIFLTDGLVELGGLRTSYITQNLAEYYFRDEAHIVIRYVLLFAIIPLMYFNFLYTRSLKLPEPAKIAEKLFLHVVILTVMSNELIHWMELNDIHDTFKLALSILWGAYGLFMIILGLWKDLKYLRIGAMALFGVTLVKLFFYDMADMSTISKTVVMITLSVLFLIASFLYNKHKRATS